MRVKMHYSIRRTVVATCLLAMTAALLPLTAAHAQTAESCAVNISEYEGSASLSVTPLTVAAGGSVTIAGQGFPPNSTVPLSFNGQEFATATTDDAGSFSVPFTVPANTPAGVVTFSALCGAFTLTAQLTIQGVPTTLSTGGTLTPTGSDSGQLVQVALALLAAGVLLVFLARRQARRRVPVAARL